MRRGETAEISLHIPVTDADFASIASVAQQVTSLQLYRLHLRDPATSGLRSFKELAVLRIEGQSISDSLVDEIVRLKKLQVLNLPAGGVTDEHLQRFSELPQLRLLRVSGSRITDAGMAFLPHFPQLRFLHLIDVSVTDAGLEPLRRCQQLQSVYLDRTDGITNQGLRQLLQDCPEIHFHRDQLHLPDDPQADHE